ncbi:hypothetical protein RAB80_016176 [Fusarium oxysporum f. sp. vasinfectum]|nr:hypothetical protein RAB80_016176 [Fusarium oxysporum f. sp. vasinfectum]
MRIDEQGDKIACSKCRDGHRTSTCIDAPGHQDDVQVIRRAGRPEGSKNDPARAAERREKKRKRQVEKELEEEAAAFRREAHAFCLQRPASDPVQGNFAAGYPQVPVPRPIRRLLEQPYYAGVGYAPASPTPAVPLPVSAPSVPDFPLTAPGHAASVVPFGMDGSWDFGFEMPIPVPGPHFPAPFLGSGVVGNSFGTSFQHPMPALGHTSLHPFDPASSAPVSQPVLANQFDTMARNSLVNNPITGFPQVGMMAQADQVDNMMIQTTPEDLMEAGDTVLPIAQPIPAANNGVQSSGSPSSSGSWAFLDHPSSEFSPTTGLAALGTLANQGASASPVQYAFLDTAPHVTDPFADEDLYGPG